MEEIAKVQPREGLFIISPHYQYLPPCEGAFKGKVTRVDTRTVDCPSKVPAYQGLTDWWYNEGTNHRVVNGKITRDLYDVVKWFVEIPDLLEFVSKHGECSIYETEHDGFYGVEVKEEFCFKYQKKEKL